MRYGLKRRLRKGIRLKIFPTFVCTLDCAYCGNKLGGDHRPVDRKLMTWQEWAEYIDTFPMKINEVFLSGGEPTLLEGFEHLINHISGRYLVTVYTNLTNHTKWNRVNSTDNIRIQATFHGRSDKQERFLKAYHSVKQLHRVDVEEIAENRLGFSRVKPWGCTVDLANIIDKNYFWVAPDGMIFRNCYGVINYMQ